MPLLCASSGRRSNESSKSAIAHRIWRLQLPAAVCPSVLLLSLSTALRVGVTHSFAVADASFGACHAQTADAKAEYTPPVSPGDKMP